MDNIEQLKLDNEKLKERLNNAAKFFRDQKAQIEALTKENEELKDQINRTPQEEVISTEKYNTLVTEKEFLNKQCNEYELKIQDLEKKLEERLQNLRAVENTTNEEVKKVTVARDEWIEKYHKLEKDVTELKNTIDSKDKAYKVLQDTYNEVFNDCLLLKETNKSLENNLNNSKDAYSELSKTYEEHLVKDKEKNNKILVQDSQIKEFTEQIKEQDKKIKDLETINDTINKQLDDEENHRLAIENDYNDLVERVNKVDENTCKFNKKDINEFCDNMLDFFKNHQL